MLPYTDMAMPHLCPTYAVLVTTSVPADLVVHSQHLSFLAGELLFAGFLLSTPQLIVDRCGCTSKPPLLPQDRVAQKVHCYTDPKSFLCRAERPSITGVVA